MIKRECYKKTGSHWKSTFIDKNPETVYQSLALDLIAKKINECSYITKITRRNNYDGTQTITVYYSNDIKQEYVVKN